MKSNRYTFHSILLITLHLLLSHCKTKEDNTVRDLFILSSLSQSTDISVTVTAKGDGFLSNPKMEVREPSSSGECTSSSSGSFIQELTLDSNGTASITLPAGVYCFLALPASNTTMASNAIGLTSSEQNISFAKYDENTPYLSAIVYTSGIVNLSPLTRFAAERYAILSKASGTSYSISSYLSPITSSATSESRPIDSGSLAAQANREIAEIFFPDSSAVENMASTSLNLSDNDTTSDETKFNLLLAGMSYLAQQIASDIDGDGTKEPSIQDYEVVWSAIGQDLTDGMADGVYFDGSSLQETTISRNDVSIHWNSLSDTFQRELLSYASSSETSFSSTDASSLEFCPIPSYNGSCYSASSCNSSGSDPLFSDQWHLSNTGQSGGSSGEDINVSSVWSNNNMGQGIIVAVVDDGADIFHEDLKENFIGGSWNFITNTTRQKNDPSSTSMSHGTAVSGLIAAKGWNSTGLRGVAPCAHLVAWNLLQNYNTTNEIFAMSGNRAIAVSNNSWGATDGLGTLAPANSTWQDAVVDGLTYARGGKGTVYIWAAGNGSHSTLEIDNSNYDGQANHYGVISVAAIGNDGVKASYSDEGANVFIAAPSQGANGGTSNVAISTTDATNSSGYNSSSSSSDYSDNNYTKTFNGTSSSAPVVAGVAALVLKQNPSLTWRDVRLVLAKSARKNDSSDSDWTTNAAGLAINHKYGFGAVDAAQAISLASSWSSIGGSSTLLAYPSSSSFSETSPGSSIPDNTSSGVSSSITVSDSNISKIEFIEIKVKITHTYSGDLKIVLSNSSGTKSELALQHLCFTTSGSQTNCGQYSDWVFGSVRHMDESANSTWTLTVSDLVSLDTGTVESWGIKFYGR
ncbi:MAG: S8 family serine peptidase [Spirochaetota bacterium]